MLNYLRSIFCRDDILGRNQAVRELLRKYEQSKSVRALDAAVGTGHRPNGAGSPLPGPARKQEAIF